MGNGVQHVNMHLLINNNSVRTLCKLITADVGKYTHTSAHTLTQSESHSVGWRRGRMRVLSVDCIYIVWCLLAVARLLPGARRKSIIFIDSRRTI